MNKSQNNKKQTIIQFVKFGMVGLSNTIISYCIYSFSLLVIRRYHFFVISDYLFAQAVAFIISVLWSYCLNRRFVFKSDNSKKHRWICRLVKTYISYSFTGLFLNSALLIFWISVCHISEYVAPLINLILNVPLNFLMNKYWAFNE